MPASLIRKLAWLVGALLLLAATAYASLPLLASTQLVRDRIALEMSVWSGYRVDIGATPEITIWPSFKATMTNVRLWEWRGGEAPVVEAERVEADLSPIAALRGDVLFTSLKLVRPSIQMSRDGFNFSMPPSAGRFAQAIDYARALVAVSPDGPSPANMPRDPLGTLELEDGRLSIVDQASETEVLTSFNGRLVWPTLDRPANVTLSGIWRGEVVSVEVSSGEPLLLLAGGKAQVTANLRSSPLNVSFGGRANLSADKNFSGTLRMTAPSMRRALEWSRSEIVTNPSFGGVSVEGMLNGAPDRMHLTDAVLSLDQNPGRGTLDISLADQVPAISGTLAFEQIDLASFLAAFSNVTQESWARYGMIDNRVSRQLAVDLRLSAQRATAGSITLSDVAATAQVKGGLSAFDISDASVFGGTLQAGIRIDSDEQTNQVEIRARGDGLDMASFSSTVQASNLIPIAQSDFTLHLKGRGRNWFDIVQTAEGTLNASFGAGSMAGLDIDGFIARASMGEFFPLREVGGGTVAFQQLDLRATAQEGVATLEKLELRTADRIVALEGLVPLPGRGLALTGSISPHGTDGTPAPPIYEFFVGGSWDAPFISPITFIRP